MDINATWEFISDWLLTSGLRILLIVVLTLVALRATRFVSTGIFATSKMIKHGESQKRADTVQT